MREEPAPFAQHASTRFPSNLAILSSLLCFFMFQISIVVFCNQKISLRIHAVFNLRNQQENKDNDSHTDIAQIAHDNRKHRPYSIPVKHTEISAVVCEAYPTGDECRTEDLNQS